MAPKKTKTRYVLQEQVGSGDFAKVYAAEDTKLGRKVAIKQLHSHFLDDQEKLERYWRESRLMLDLDHPNIMTIYDVIKSRGCLVLELMQGSLKEIFSSKAMPVDDVRETIIQAARGLECMHRNGIVHGDIKPANLMLSRQDVVKLGDFGLARRVSDDEGSLLKGTTKYMAPELVSEDFGEVGPASDLYSLGFSALELMIGPDFDSLFPDLIAFGRDKQMAWMMWHCSADRKFPPIQTMLDGVPGDLAIALNRLTNKDQSKRYKTASEVISDLSGGVKPVGESLKEAELAKQKQEEQRKKKRRRRAIMACVASALLCTAILTYPYWGKSKAKPVAQAPPPVRGVIQNVLPVDEKFVIDIGSDWKEFTLRSRDKVTLNRKSRQLRDLQLGDRVVVNSVLDAEGRSHREIVGFRPETHSGLVSGIDFVEATDDVPATATLLFTVTEGEESGHEFSLSVSNETEITLNEKLVSAKGVDGISDLGVNDRVQVNLSDDENGMLALKVDALRLTELKGFIRKLDPRRGQIVIATSLEEDAELVTLPIDPKSAFTLNGLTAVDGRLLSPADLEVDDRVTLMHDVKIVSADAFRVFKNSGRVDDIDFEAGSVVMKSPSATALQNYRVGDKTKVMLGSEEANLVDLRVGDTIKIVHESPDDDSPVLVSLDATRASKRNRWAILVANQKFDSANISPLSTPIQDIEIIKSRLIDRFGVPKSQIAVFLDEERVRLEQEIPNHLARASKDCEFYVYVATKAYADKGPNDDVANAFLAAKDSVPSQIDSTGVKLEWLIDELDKAVCSRKILMLDFWNDEGVVSATEMVELVQSKKRGGYPRTAYVLTNCGPSQQAALMGPAQADGAKHGLFGYQIAQAFSGKADLERDSKVEITELTDFVIERVSSVSKTNDQPQTPFLFVPDNRPPRLSDSAKRGIIDMLSKFGVRMAKEDIIIEAMKVNDLVNNQPEPMLACGLLLIKQGKTREAYETLENVRLAHMDHIITQQAVIWVHYNREHYRQGCELLAKMLTRIPLPEEGADYDGATYKKFEWAGRLRELAQQASPWTKSDRLPTEAILAACDNAIKAHGDKAEKQYLAGRKRTREIAEAFAARLKKDASSSASLERERLKSYVPPIASLETIAEIRAGLDRE